MSDTIYARATGPGPSAIAIVRISGPEAPAVASKLTGRVPQARIATLVTIRDPGRDQLLDRGLALFFPAPASATGEDLLELHVHGGRAVIAAVEQALEAVAGCRLAEAGEFTRRAVVNGRLDLLEAEALGELLAADTEVQRRAAAAGGSRLRETVDALQDVLLAISADVEAAIDHDEAEEPADVGGRVRALATRIAALLARPTLERLRDGFLVVIGGPPNAGKSTLFNALVGDEAAIVSDRPGTTRDALERTLTVSGIPIRLVDTAGQRGSGEDDIEAVGIERAAALSARADLLLWLDGAPPPAGVDTIRVQSRSDAVGDLGWADICVSGFTGEGINDLVNVIVARLQRRLPPPEEVLVNARQRAALVEAEAALRRASVERDLVLVAADLVDARRAFDRLTGRAGVEDLLDQVFSRFCLGK